MVQKRFQIVKQHATSPLTLRAVLLFIAITIVAIMVVRDELERRRQTELYARIEQSLVLAASSQSSLDQQNEAFEAAMQKAGDVFEEIAEVIRVGRETRQAEHARWRREEIERTERIAKATAARIKRLNKKPPRECWKQVKTIKNFNSTEVIEIRYDRTKCP